MKRKFIDFMGFTPQDLKEIRAGYKVISIIAFIIAGLVLAAYLVSQTGYQLIIGQIIVVLFLTPVVLLLLTGLAQALGRHMVDDESSEKKSL